MAEKSKTPSPRAYCREDQEKSKENGPKRWEGKPKLRWEKCRYDEPDEYGYSKNHRYPCERMSG